MTNEQLREFCLELLKADSEQQVINILKGAGYWEDPSAWRLLGDRENQYSLVGNQQGRSDAALAEKIINSIDHLLLKECLLRGIQPESTAAPQSIREAVSLFFEGKPLKKDSDGLISEWTVARRTEVSEGIAVAVTGAKARGGKNPCVMVVDQGEGQTPNKMPTTFLSLARSNKMRIPFVQGKYNMGGTGVLEFCGSQNLQLIITRRNPDLVVQGAEDPSDDCWGITVVRRENASGNDRNSVYTYLAPVGSDVKQRKGEVLRFQADSLPLMPEKRNPYAREIQWGSLVKLYEYDMKGFASNAMMKDGLLYRLDARLPNVALPVRVHECRSGYRGHEGSFDTTLTGLSVRLEDDRANNLEAGYPDPVVFSVHGEEMVARIYAFKKGRAATYRKNEGVIFTVNGQTHGYIPKTIFNRKGVKMDRLADSLLVVIECTGLSPRSIERLFMASRDRLRDNQLRQAIEKQLEKIIGSHVGLKALSEQRRAEDVKNRLADDKPLEDVLGSIFKSSPSLSKLFLEGLRLARPFKKAGAGSGNGNGSGNGSGSGSANGKGEFLGVRHPTYFRFAKNHASVLERGCEQGRSCRVDFETDVENGYFGRTREKGELKFDVLEGDLKREQIKESSYLRNGRVHVSFDLPDSLQPGAEIKLKCSVKDETLVDSFDNVLTLTVQKKVEREGGESTRKRRNNGSGDGPLDTETGISLPKMVPVEEKQWDDHDFDQHSACKVIEEAGAENAPSEYTFYINVDNVYLKTDMKASKEDPKVLRAKFVFGNVLMGLAVINEQRAGSKSASADSENEPTLGNKVGMTTRAMAPFLLPMINQLSALSDEDVATFGEIGDDE